MTSPRRSRRGPMTQAELEDWLFEHGGYAGEKENTRIIPEVKDLQGRVTSPSQRAVESITYTAADGSTITVEQRQAPAAGEYGPHILESGAVFEAVGETPPDKTRERTSAQTRADEAAALAQEHKNAEAERERDERWWNQNRRDQGGSGLPETHTERAKREADELNAQRQREATQAQIESSRASAASATARIEQDRNELGYRRENDAANRQLQERELREREAAGAYTRGKPDFLSTAEAKNPYVVRYDPSSGAIVSEANPNYDAVRAAAEERRAELASQIASRRIGLDEAQAQYSQWFDLNVKGPMMMAQEARARAEERRQALEAEERRRQFAADFGLRKAQLGETAANRATQAEISLLPYRGGPTLASEMSSAINSLAAGGKVYGPDASAGIKFTPEAFQFDAPNFRKIAKKAASDALRGISNYQPSDESFDVGDYSNIPGINLSNAPTFIPPAYQYPPPEIE